MQTEKIEYQSEFSFIDKKGNRVKCKAEIKDGRFTMSGDYENGLGQVFDRVQARTKTQKRLIEIWKEYHLNDFHNKPLPAGFRDSLSDLVHEIVKTEQAEKAKRNKKEWQAVLDDDAKKAALGKFLELTPDEALEDIKNTSGNWYDYAGESYLVCTDDEADTEAKESMESYIDNCVLNEIPERYRQYFNTDKFIDDAISTDGRGHILNRYNGQEDEEQIEGVWYFIYRQ